MSNRHSRHQLGIRAAVATVSLLVGTLAAVPVAQAQTVPGGRAALAGTKPAWTDAAADQGAAADSTQVSARVYLAGRDAAGLAAYAQAVSDPNSPHYGKYLSADQAQQRFGASKQQIDAVTAWLKSAGLTVTGTNQHYISVTGDAAAVHTAFATTLHQFRKNGRTYHAPAQAASAPAALADAVLTVTGLDNTPHAAKPQDTLPGPGAGFRNSGPFSSYFGQNVAKTLPDAYGSKIPYAIHGYTGKQLRAAYGAGKFTGKGVTVAITDAYASPTMAADAAQYAKNNGDQAYRKGQYTEVLPAAWNSTTDCGASGWYGEESLDVEAVHAVAPDANIVYVAGASCNDPDLLDALNKVVDNHLADIVSNSWADVEANETADTAAAYDHTFMMGAIQGIGFYFSSGDDGDEAANTGTKQIATPANSVWATAVGGTSLAVGKNDKYLFETGWGTLKAKLSADGKGWDNLPGAFNGGAGGGTSTSVKQPFYQRGIVPDSLAKANGPTAMRTIPDIAAVADPNTGFLVGQTQTWADGSVSYDQYRIGGTSLAAPVIAGVQALAQQAKQRPIGFANPSIYERANSRVIHDVTDTPLGANHPIAQARVDFANGTDASGGTVTSVRTAGHDSSLSATKGYDDVTGVGTPAPGYVASFANPFRG
ncbi:serine protease [Kitasatospora sp. MMS16-BH015]|uniref:S53 family peptidase n=1 Tax=Kitasatospora sp. MMS16-BH015 TaxID=2018025 RepID=UPI000CA123DD|nr:S53 family peptidase [Kitasatospora sp. MMS16-BH015]AUG82116.1 serine protease [Kitasatospora sp. MMS16-BH015]